MIRETIPPTRSSMILDNIGLPGGGVNLAFSDASIVSAADGEILVALKPEQHGPTAGYVGRLRTHAARALPRPDVLLPARRHRHADPELRSAGADRRPDRRPRPEEPGRSPRTSCGASPRSPAPSTSTCSRSSTRPTIDVDVDRRLAQQLGFTERDVATSLLVSLSGIGRRSRRTTGSIRQNGVNYPVGVQTPQYRIDSMDALNNTPVVVAGPAAPAAARQPRVDSPRTSQPAVISHYNVQPVLDVLADVQGRDLWSVASAVERVVDEVRPTLPRGTFITIRGQAEAMRTQLHGAGLRHAARRAARLPADGGELPVVDRSVHHPDGAARRASPASCGSCFADADHHHRAGADGRDHVHRRGDQQLASCWSRSPTTSAHEGMDARRRGAWRPGRRGCVRC